MNRPQFSLKTLLWLMVVVAAFFVGRASQIGRNQRRVLQLEDKLYHAEKSAKRESEALQQNALTLSKELEKLRAER